MCQELNSGDEDDDTESNDENLDWGIADSIGIDDRRSSGRALRQTFSEDSSVGNMLPLHSSSADDAFDLPGLCTLYVSVVNKCTMYNFVCH